MTRRDKDPGHSWENAVAIARVLGRGFGTDLAGTGLILQALPDPEPVVKRVLTLVVAILVVYAGIASAHGPTRKKVVIHRDIAAPPENVWALIRNFQDMSWHPAIVETVGEGGTAPGATRTLTLGNGGKIHEKLEKYDTDKRSLFYRIEEVDVNVLPVTNYSSWLSVKPTATGRSA